MHWQHTTYGDTWAELYDELHAGADDTEPSVQALAQLANGGSALELGGGTGRLAVPLAQKGVDVDVIEVSDKMIDILRSKMDASGTGLRIHQTDMCDFDLGREFDVVYLSHNTLTDLATQVEQLACVTAAARHLSPNGVFVLDLAIPTLESLAGDGTLRYSRADSDGVWVVGRRHHWNSQQIITQRLRLGRDTGFFHGTMMGRYVWPSEVDLMARIAGLELGARWADWYGHDFAEGSHTFISHYRRRAAA